VAESFDDRAREHYTAHAQAFPHHPLGGYAPGAFRHYHRAELLRRTLHDLDFETALDVGCADGFFVQLLGELGARAMGLDLAEPAVERVVSVFHAPGVVGDGTRLPFRDDAFDLVLTTETLEHVLAADVFVAELQRVARRWVVVTVPVGHDEEPDLDFADEGHVQDFDRSALRALFGEQAEITSTRCNATFGAYSLVGRHLGRRVGERCIRADLAVADRWGREDHRFWPLRTRSFVVVAPAEASR
jgi:SAM-dependent methyltransferase